MKRILALFILITLCQITVSLEIAYMKPLYGSSDEVAFSEDGQKIFCIYSGGTVVYVLDVKNGSKTDVAYGEDFYSAFKLESVAQLGQFAYIYGREKFGREQRILLSLVHGKKPISEETWQNLRTGTFAKQSDNRDSWAQSLYGNSGVRSGERKFVWGEEYFGIEFFSGSKTVDLPIEMVYGASVSGWISVQMSYDLFTGTFFEQMRYEGEEEIYSPHLGEFSEPYDTNPEFSRILHIFNLIYDGSIAAKTEIRETPSHDGKILGYLNEGESVKVSKAENYEKREVYQDYWYYVTGDSYSGWCTGEFLLIEGGTWYNRFELRDTYVEWDEIPESENILKTPLYGLTLVDTNLYELPAESSMSRWEELELVENYPINGSAEKGSVVEVLDRNYYSQVGGARAYFKIRLENGAEGWILEDDIYLDLYGTTNWGTTGIKSETVNSKSPERHGVINDTQVRLRKKPSLDGEILEHLNTGDEVTIIAKTTEKYQVGDMDDYWYKVYKVKEDVYFSGWVYGAFVDFVVVENTAEILDVEDAPDITVATDEENTAIPWVIGGAVLLLGAIVTVIIVKKKKS